MGYTWSFDRDAEIWDNDEYDTVKECVDAAKAEMDLEEGQSYVYVGECVPYSPEADCTDILDRMQEQAAEMCGEVGDNWEPYDWRKKDELEELNDILTVAICAWLKKYGYYPGCYRIQNIREYLLYD